MISIKSNKQVKMNYAMSPLDSITFDDIDFDFTVEELSGYIDTMTEDTMTMMTEDITPPPTVADVADADDEIDFGDIDFGVFEPVFEPVQVRGVKRGVKRAIHDPSDPSAPSGIATYTGGEVIRSDRRNANKKNIVRECLTARDHQRFADSMMANAMSIPTVEVFGETYLCMDDISDELLRTGAEARGLSTIVLSRKSLSENVAFGMHEVHGITLSNMDTCEKVMHIKHLVGQVIPIFGQVRKPPSGGFGDKSKIYQNHKQVIRGEYHRFAYEPVIIATSGDGPGDSGEIIAQGVVVSNKGLNFPVGDARRVSLGRKSEFEESVCWVLITHYYKGTITYAAIGPPSTKKNGDSYITIDTSHKNKYDHVFRWSDFMNNNMHLRGCGVSLFGFTDTKQVGKDITRRLFPWSVSHAMETLSWYRERGRLDEFMINSPMTTVKRASGRIDIPSGMDVRRFLLAELLLKGTPLESMLTNQRVVFCFDAPNILGGGAGLYMRLHNYCFAMS